MGNENKYNLDCKHFKNETIFERKKNFTA